MTFKEDFKPSRVYNKLVIDAINKDIANDRSIIIPNTFDIDIKNNNKNIYVVLDVWNVLILVKLIGIGNNESKRINNDDKDENDSIEKEGYKYNEDKCNNKDNDDDDSDNDDD